MSRLREFTLLALSTGILVAVVMTAANVYLGLYAGMTISASIPAAVIAMAVFRGVLRRRSLLESNLVQTVASAGESLAAGIIFTIPALVITATWTGFEFWPTTLIAMAGGLLGVVFMVPLRRALIVERKDLIYPEGVACASVLKTGSEESAEKSGGIVHLLWGSLIGGAVKFLESGLSLVHGKILWAGMSNRGYWGFGLGLSPALLAVGYIVHLRIAALVFLGGFIGWMVAMPMVDPPEAPDIAEGAYEVWSGQIRYLGVGAMIVGGIASIFSVRKGIASGLGHIMAAWKGPRREGRDRTEQELSFGGLLLLFAVASVLTFGVYYFFLDGVGITLLSTLVMILLSFLFVAVSSYIVGLVGCSNNPVSGMTISALLFTALLFLALGYQGSQAIAIVLGVAAVVCCAACISGDCSQDLKTGLMVGATPRWQQWGQVVGVVACAGVLAPVLSLLNEAYGIGAEGDLKAPQASLFASLAEGLFGDGILPYRMIAYGMVLGLAVLALDAVLRLQGSTFRLHLMPVAVGIYLPIELSTPILIGGLVRWGVESFRGKSGSGTDSGVLISSGLIAGEALMGVLVALLIVTQVVPGDDEPVYGRYVSLIPFVLVAAYLFLASQRDSR